ncbi:ABC transporter permease [Phytohabitans rumicis]|uniref:ABC transporter permease n=1 Tax=Phytohabitans rumicis TaxID=1076125 RepID=A0A6V8L5S8_9ACTN|nr:ABC transporter permease [Phytohabitans rumicis]GFJ92603.1 ABC transporter permease [Phytohabitans rumicis]
MIAFLVRRIVAGIILVFVIATVTFGLMSLTGQDPARAITGQTASPEQVSQKAAELGLDRSLPVRYVDWLSHAVRGDLGSSWFTNEPVTSALSNKLPVTLSIVLAGLLLSAVLSVVLGVAAAVRGGWLDRAVQGLAILGFAVPSFLVALLLALVVAVKLGWLPATGYVPLEQSPGEWLRSITLPAVALAVGAIAATAQQVRGSMVDVLRMDYIRTLRSRGVSERSLLFRHALRNAAPPALTVLSLQFIGLLSGAVVVEKVFGLAGIGSEANSAASQGDVPMVMGVVVVMVLMVVLVNLLIDIAYGWLNPKVRVS